jgi:hypothetical protein
MREETVGIYGTSSSRTTEQPTGAEPIFEGRPVPWWLKGLISKRTEPRWAYALGVFGGIGLTVLMSLVSPLGSFLSSIQVSNFWLVSPDGAAALLVAFALCAPISAAMILAIERSYARKRVPSAPFAVV